MTDHDRLISETIRETEKIIVSLTLIIQSLSGQLPQHKTQVEKSEGFYICPKTGRREWFDKKAKARFEKAEKRGKLTLINKEA